jgi:cobalt-zinc-cadmium efflux system membrane fusion protein
MVESPDADVAMSSYLQAEAGITQAKAALAKAVADMERTKDLFEHNAVAKKELVNAEAMHTQAVAAVEQAQAGSKQAFRRLEILGLKPGEFAQKVTVRAPLSGKVLDLGVAPGEFRNDTSASLMTIADLSSVWVSADVPETQIRLVQIGERVQVELEAYPGEVFPGKVAQIADIVDPQTRTVKVRAEMANPKGRFRPEMFARIRHSDGMMRKPVIPNAALILGDGQSLVYRQIETGKFRQTPIQLGVRVGNMVAVLDGLKAGDQIATDGVMLLKSN